MKVRIHYLREAVVDNDSLPQIFSLDLLTSVGGEVACLKLP